MTVDAVSSHCESFSVLDGLERLYWWQRTHCNDWVFHQDWYSGFILFTAANYKCYLTSYKLVIIISIINKWCATINGIYCQHFAFPRSCPSDWQKSCILSFLCLYPGVCTWSQRLPTGKYSSMTRTRIWRSFRSQNPLSELPTFDHCVKCSSICWWSNLYGFETIVCHKISNWCLGTGSGSWHASFQMPIISTMPTRVIIP